MEKRPAPKFLVTYLCRACGWDFAVSEFSTPRCTRCRATENLTEMSREALTLDVMEARMQRVADRLLQNLAKAYEIREGHWPDDKEEELVLEALAKAKDLQEEIGKAFGKAHRKEQRVQKGKKGQTTQFMSMTIKK